MSNMMPISHVFEGQEVRFVGTPDVPEWIAQDVCNVLEIAEARSSMRGFDEDEKGVHSIHTPGGEQEVLTVKEPGLYRLIFKSRKTIAKRFQKWIFNDVLPSIRRTGSYSLPAVQPQAQQLLPSKDDIDFMVQRCLGAGVGRTIAEVRAIEIYTSPRPYLREAADSFKSLIATNNPVEELPVTPTELGEAIARQLGLSKRVLPQAVNEALGQLGLQEKKSRISRKTGKEKHEWVMSEAGKPYGEILVTAIKGTGDTKFQIRWFPSKVLPVLLPLFQEEAT